MNLWINKIIIKMFLLILDWNRGLCYTGALIRLHLWYVFWSYFKSFILHTQYFPFFFLTWLKRWLGVQYCGSGPINHWIFSFHRKFSLNKMTGWRFEPPTFGAESLQIEPWSYRLSYHSPPPIFFGLILKFNK